MELKKGSNYLKIGLELTDNLPSPEFLINIGLRLTKLTISFSNLKAQPALAELPRTPSLTQKQP